MKDRFDPGKPLHYKHAEGRAAICGKELASSTQMARSFSQVTCPECLASKDFKVDAATDALEREDSPPWPSFMQIATGVSLDRIGSMHGLSRQNVGGVPEDDDHFRERLVSRTLGLAQRSVK